MSLVRQRHLLAVRCEVGGAAARCTAKDSSCPTLRSTRRTSYVVQYGASLALWGSLRASTREEFLLPSLRGVVKVVSSKLTPAVINY